MIGLDAYYPLTATAEPSVAEIAAGWKLYSAYFEALHARYQLPVRAPPHMPVCECLSLCH